MVVSIIVASMESRASRRSYALFLLQLNLIFSPFLLLLVLLSSLLSAPLLPLFTLPVFFVSFPRPARFWPGAVGHQEGGSLSADCQLYAQASQRVAEAVCSACRAAAISLSPGSTFLLRHEDRLMWVQVVPHLTNKQCCNKNRCLRQATTTTLCRLRGLNYRRPPATASRPPGWSFVLS